MPNPQLQQNLNSCAAGGVSRNQHVDAHCVMSSQKNSQRQLKSDCVFCLQYFKQKFSRIKDCSLFFQESYVWKMYQERSWEFFPVGDCFRKQYEDQLGWM